MADIQASPSPQRRGPRPIKVDMTPMVDLAFLLLTFFILTTTLRRQQGLDLTLPSKGKSGKDRPELLTFLISGTDGIHAYRGAFHPDSTRIRQYGLDQVRAALRAVKDTAQFRCVLKAHPSTKYSAMVRMLDEVAVVGAGHYAVDDSLSPAEQAAWDLLLVRK